MRKHMGVSGQWVIAREGLPVHPPGVSLQFQTFRTPVTAVQMQEGAFPLG